MAQWIIMGAPAMSEAVYLCLHLREFPTQALLRHRPELRHTAVVVMSGEPPQEQLCSLNTEAMRRGARRGMSRAEMDSVEGVHLLRRILAEEQAARAALLEAAALFTPRIEEQPSPTAYVLVLDMTGTTLIFGAPETVANQILQTVTRLGFSAQAAISSNLLTAVCIARSARKRITLASHGQEHAALAHLPIAALAPAENHAEILALWGIRTLGELAALPDEAVAVRLGAAGRRLLLLARGEHPHLMVPVEPVFSLEEFIEFDAPVELMDSLLFVLNPMLDQLILRAQNAALALASVTTMLYLDGGGTHERTIKPALALLDKNLLLKLLHLDLQAHAPPAGVLAIRLFAEPGTQSKVQLGLFSPQLPEPAHLEVTLARITALVGEGRVGRARLNNSHAPEAFHMEPFTITATSPEPTSPKPISSAETDPPKASTALRRLRPSVPVTIRAIGRQLRSLRMQGKYYEIKKAYGPWRKSGHWWSSDVWSREEWDIVASSPNTPPLLALLTHDLLRHQWHIEALYD